MPPVGLETTIPASTRPQAYALDRSATGIGDKNLVPILNVHKLDMTHDDGENESHLCFQTGSRI
jgi:hypothetical protein